MAASNDNPQQGSSEQGLLDLLRHGICEPDNIFRGRVDHPLNEAGWEQMRAATEKGHWQQVITSPLKRCQEFAQYLGERNECEVEVDSRLQEYHFGDWDGRTFEEVMAHSEQEVIQFFDDTFNHTPPGGESFQDFSARVVEGYQHALSLSTNRNVIVVTHGGVILSILAELLGLDRVHGRIEVPYACMTRVRCGEEGDPARLINHGVVM